MIKRSARSAEALRLFARNVSGAGRPLQGLLLVRRAPVRKGPLVLLGESGEIPVDSFVEVLTCGSPDEPFFLRILKEKRTSRHEAFLVHPEPDRYRFAFLKIEGRELDFLTDAHGRASLGPWTGDLGRERIRIQPAFAVYSLSLGRAGRPSGKLKSLWGKAKERDRSLILSCDTMAGKKVLRVKVPAFERRAVRGERVVLISGGRRVRISIPQRGVSIFEGVEPGRNHQINLYE